MDKKFHPTYYNGYNHLFMLGLKLIHVINRGPQSSTGQILSMHDKGVLVFHAEVFLIPGSLPCQGISIPINSLRSRQNGRHFADDTFKCFFLNEKI